MPPAGADAAEQRPGFSLGHRLPGLEGQHRTGFRVPAARQADLGPLPGLVGLAPADAQPQAAGDDGDVLDLQGDEFGAAQRGGEAEQQQRAVAPAAGGASQVASSWRSMASDSAAAFSHRPAVQAQQGLQRHLDVAVPGVPGQVVEAVHLADRRQAAADRRRRVAFGQAGR